MNYHLRSMGDKFVVSSTSFASPLQELLEIAAELKIKQYSGEVLFDLLCVNGISDNRFVTILFDGVRFDRRTVKRFEKSALSFVKSQDDFYKLHPAYIANSVLSENARLPYL